MTDAAKTIDVPDASTPRLTCYFKSRSEATDGETVDSVSRKAFLFQETGKKSSYVLQQQIESPGNEVKDANNPATQRDNIDYYSIPKPSHFVVEHVHPNSNTSSHFFFGGFQIISTKKMFEIYLTSQVGKEIYLMTCKGIPYKKEDTTAISAAAVQPKPQKWYRGICVVPGGPRSISKLRIKTIGSNSEDDMILYMKLTARIAENPSPLAPVSVPAPAPAAIINSNTNRKSKRVDQKALNHTFAPITNNAGEALTQSDLGAAMAGLSFMGREIEKNIAELLKEQSKKIEMHTESCFSKIELDLRDLKSTIITQHQSIEENQIIIKEQNRIMENQGSQINKLLNNEEDLKVRVQSLQADISILRYQVPKNVDIGGGNVDDDDDVRNNPGPITAGIDPRNTVLSVDDIKDSFITSKAVNESTDCTTGERNGKDETCQNSISDEERDIKIENIHLKRAIKNTAKIVAEPVAGCFPMMGDTEGEVRLDLKNVEEKREIKIDGKPFGGCGPIFIDTEEDVMRNIDAMVLSHPTKKISPEFSPNNDWPKIVNKDEECNYTANIEVALVEEEPSPDNPPISESSYKELSDSEKKEDE